MQRHHQPHVDPRRPGLPVKRPAQRHLENSPLDLLTQLHQRVLQIHQPRPLETSLSARYGSSALASSSPIFVLLKPLSTGELRDASTLEAIDYLYER